MTEVIRLAIVREPDNDPGLWPTSIYTGITKTILSAREASQLCAIVGPSGIGKTFAARAAVEAARAEGDRAQMIEMSPALGARYRGLLQQLVAAFGADVRVEWQQNRQAAADELEDALIYRLIDLARDGRPPNGILIVIDEGDFAKTEVLQGVRCLHDAVRRHGVRIAVVLIGTATLTKNIRRVPAVVGRVTLRAFGKLSVDDEAAICRAINAERGAEPAVRRAAQLPGGLRAVAMAVENARLLAGEGRPLRRSDLEEAVVAMG
jgi:hypothetical protein